MATHTGLRALLLILFLLPSGALADAVVKGKLKGPGRRPAKQVLTAVQVLDVEGGRIVASARPRKPKKFRTSAPALPLMVAASVTNRRDGARYEAVGPVLRPVDGKKVKAKLVLAPAEAPPAAAAALGTAVAAPAAAEPWNVGVPATEFTVSGPGLEPFLARGEADLVTVDLVNSRCYDDKFFITETDPRMLEERAREIALSQSPLADPATRMEDLRVEPDKIVSGAATSDGTTVTIALVLRDAMGAILASGTASGPADAYFDVHEAAVGRLIDEICDEGLRVTLTSATCPAEACTCCDEGAFCLGERWTERMEGVASGAVGTVLQVNFPETLGGDLSCPGWTRETCDADLACCRRTSEGQPAQVTFEATLTFPPFGFCVCPPPPPVDTHLLAQVFDGTSADEDERVVGCPE